jgi:hypothetical protein
MRRELIVLIAAVLGIAAPVVSQYRVDPKNRGERIIAVVPMIGSGKGDDPKRPLFAPLPSEMRRPGGIQEFSYELSDDGKYAIIEFVASDRSAFDAMLRDTRAVKAFEKGKHKREDIERELRIFRRSFSFDPVPTPQALRR